MQTVPRLFKTFQPNEYFLELTLEREARTFHGTVGIKGNYSGGSPLTLHARDLEIVEVRIDYSLASAHIENVDHLIFDKELQPGEHHVLVEFQGKISDAMHGLYPCYFEVDGVKKELLATQFESHHAREVFPCVDEPEAKAVFNLALKTESNLTVLSNMPARTIMPEDNATTTVFEPTPRMSPYLLAFVVGELQSKSAQTSNGTQVNVFATHAQSAKSLDFALETAVKSIEFFNDYFGTPYPLPKCDHVALPDFSSGAMENWGLITYREICLLVDETTALSTKEYAATVIAHETSHQWFGNLVTMKWWDDLWLNESFATLMEYVAVDAIYPKWNIWMTFATSETLSALRRDYLKGVQAVKTSVNHPDEISSLFDPSIVYAKGARLLKMLHTYIGEEAFRSGLSHYFKTYSYQNTIGDDLWTAFSDVTGLDIKAFMQEWLERPGLPVVSVEKTKEGYRLSQERFFANGENTEEKPWPIPLHASSDEFPVLFDTKEIIIPSATDGVYLNKDNSGHFVTAYSDEVLQPIIMAIAAQTLPAVDRLSLLHEASLLARAGKSSAASLYSLLAAYSNEQEEPVWDIISMIIADLKRFVQEDEQLENTFKAFVVKLASPLFVKLGWTADPDEPETDTKLRATIIGLLSYGEYQPVIDEGLSLFHAAEKIELLDGELRAVIFGIAAKYGEQADRDRLFDLYRSSNVADIQQDALSGLTTTRDADTLTKLIAAITDETIVRAQDVDHWFVYLIRNKYAREQTWQWMVDNWGWITDKFAGDKSYDSFPRYAASGFHTFTWLEKFQTFFAPLRTQPALTRAIDLGIEDIAGKAAWIDRDSESLKQAILATK